MPFEDKILWNPSPEHVQYSELTKYIQWLQQHSYTKFQSYQNLHQWSVNRIEDFWTSIWKWSGIKISSGYNKTLSSHQMPGAKWFEGAKLNFAENLLSPFLSKRTGREVLVSVDEESQRVSITDHDLIYLVTVLQEFLLDKGVCIEDRVVGVVPNSHEPIAAMLATTSLGALWSSCSPEFAEDAIVDRFSQIEPKVLFAVNGYSYNGKNYDLTQKIQNLCSKVPSIKIVVWIEHLATNKKPPASFFRWKKITSKKTKHDLTFIHLPFDHPIYILYSSGTTGKPKCIVHGAGGVFLQHAKELRLHGNVTGQSTMMYYTTCGWMMWNWMVSSLMVGTKLILYNGSPGYPSLERLWSLIEQEKVTHFGTSAKFLSTCRQENQKPSRIFSLESLSTIFSTGSPLLSEEFDWVYSSVKNNILLSSISGGTDIVSCFVLGCPILPVYRGEIQCKGLGMDVIAVNEKGEEVINEKGELVCRKPVPSMPVSFWNDPDKTLYKETYFSKYSGYWTHGDFISFNERGGSTIYGRSDATLNPGGVRIGTSEIYRQVDLLDEVKDSLVVGRSTVGDEEIVLFVVLRSGVELNPTLQKKIQQTIIEGTSPRHVPKRIYQVQDIPYTISGKKVELAVKKILAGDEVKDIQALKNPESLDAFKKIAQSLL